MSDNFIQFGRSGCNLSLLGNGEIIRKTASNVEYNFRLRNQYTKQSSFLDFNNFTKPKLYGYYEGEELHYFDMQYVFGKTFDKFCIESNISNLISSTDQLILLVKNNVRYSILTDINTNKFEIKLASLQHYCDSEHMLYFNYLRNNIPERLYIGPCHGDLTMSNIIFSDKLYLIDFLDNVFESPLIDLVKIKQDTEHNFILNMLNGNHTKVKICLDYMNFQLDKVFSDLIETKEFLWLSIYNLVRMIPYIKNIKEKKSLITSLQKYEYFITSSRTI